MQNHLIPDQSLQIPPVDLLGGGQVVAIVVGLENYQSRPEGKTLTKVDFARNDAEAFAEALKTIYPADRLSLTLLLDSEATCASLKYDLASAIKSLAPDDLFIFYYAGHGFHGAGGNRITAWDSNSFNVEGTTLLLRDVLTDQLAASSCERALVFVDACAGGFTPLGRDVVTSMNPQELKEFLGAATYSAMFLSWVRLF
jgi:Caspase domain